VVLVLGVIELGYALLDQHVIAKLSREGSNLISRDTPPGNAAQALNGMATRPVNFASGSKVIFSVIRRGGTTGTTNFGQDILYQRYAYGSGSGRGMLTTRGPVHLDGPENAANNADGDANLQITSMPAGLIVSTTPWFITEIFTAHPLITPFDKFGINVPGSMLDCLFLKTPEERAVMFWKADSND
jgi:hypothetical protein